MVWMWVDTRPRFGLVSKGEQGQPKASAPTNSRCRTPPTEMDDRQLRQSRHQITGCGTVTSLSPTKIVFRAIISFKASVGPWPSNLGGHVTFTMSLCWTRKRISQACKVCQIKKIKCSGGVPACESCVLHKRKCSYGISRRNTRFVTSPLLFSAGNTERSKSKPLWLDPKTSERLVLGSIFRPGT